MSAPEPQAGASARPWRNDHGEIFDRAGNEIARVWDRPVYVEGRANAALIVQAVNAHDALVAALQAMVDEKAEYMRINHLGDPEQQHTIRQARDALRLAAPAPAPK